MALRPLFTCVRFFDRVEAVAKKETRLAVASTINPEFRTTGTDVQIKVHESMISNYLDPLFAGKTFSKTDLENEIQSILGENSELFSGTAAAEDVREVEEFRISFSDIRPIQVVFADNRLSVVITGTKFEQGDDAIKTSLTIKVAFKIVGRGGKLFIQLDGNPEIDLAEDEKPDAESVAFARILERKLEEAAEESQGQGIELPSNLIPRLDVLKEVDVVNSLQLGLLETKDGWLYLGWNNGGGLVSTPAIWNEIVIENFEELYLPERLPILEGQSNSILEQPIEVEDTAN